MPWCPKCRNEYVEGMEVCVDCGSPLVESLEETKSNPLIFGDKEQMERLEKFLTYNKLKTVSISEDEKEGVYELYVSDEERQKAAMATRVFLQQESKEAGEAMGVMEETADNPEDEAESGHEQEVSQAYGKKAEYKGVYQDSAKQAEENRSSGYMLMVVGGIGLVAVGLIFADIIRLPAAMVNKYMVCIVMGVLFALFFVMGILSIKSSKSLEKKAESESSLTKEIKNWCMENITAAKVDDGLFAEEELAEEMKYFKRTDKMKDMICRQFMNLDEGFLDSFIDDYYPAVFEQEQGEA